jgi:hypothetical protein
MRRLIFTLLAVCATTASAHACGGFAQPPCFPIQPVQPAVQPPTMIQRFGNGAIINTPGQMPTTVQPFAKLHDQHARPAADELPALRQRHDVQLIESERSSRSLLLLLPLLAEANLASLPGGAFFVSAPSPRSVE